MLEVLHVRLQSISEEQVGITVLLVGYEILPILSVNLVTVYITETLGLDSDLGVSAYYDLLCNNDKPVMQLQQALYLMMIYLLMMGYLCYEDNQVTLKGLSRCTCV